MKTLSISTDPNIANMQFAYAITESQLNQAPLLAQEIRRKINERLERLKFLDEQTTKLDIDTKFFLTETVKFESISDNSKEIEKIKSDIEQLKELENEIKEKQSLTLECQENLKEKLHKVGFGLKEYAVSIDIGKFTKHHPFTDDEHNVNVGEFKSKLSEIFSKYNFGDNLSAHTTISRSEVDENETLLRREYISDAVYFHFTKQLMDKVDEALSEFIDYCINETLEKRFENRKDDSSYSLYEMMHEVTTSTPEELDEKIKESFRGEIERDLAYSVSVFNQSRGITLSRESLTEESASNLNKMSNALKPDYKEHYPNSSAKYKEWSENSFGGNSGIDKTVRGFEAARLLSIDSFLSENPKEVAMAKSYLSKLENSLSRRKTEERTNER